MRLCSVAPGACFPAGTYKSAPFTFTFYLLMPLHCWVVAFHFIGLAFSTALERAATVEGSASSAYHVGDDERVKRFMTTASDSVLTILNGNLWMLPGTLAIDQQERIDRFVTYARQLMPHVITLQEIWMKNQVAYLKQRFPEYQLFASGSNEPFNEAGLVTLTRIPSDSVTFSVFDVGRGASPLEQRAQKGYLTVRLETATFKACVINTHLYSPASPREHALVADQFETLKRFSTGGSYFIVGDLNLAQPAFDRLNDSFFLTEEDTSHTVAPGNRYRSVGGNASRRMKSLKSDRMLIPQALAWRFSLQSMLIREPVVSDHYLLAYRIELQRRSLAHRIREAI